MKNKLFVIICICFLFSPKFHSQDKPMVDIQPPPVKSFDSTQGISDSLVEQTEAYEEEDNSYFYEPFQRNFEPNFKENYTDEAFDYSRNVKEKEMKSMDFSWLNFLGLLGRFLMYVVLGLFILFIVFIIYKLFKNIENNKKNKNKTAAQLVDDYLEDEEHIEKNNYEKLVEIAEKNNDFRLAYRYQFNWILQKLTDNKLILWNKKKTNSDYVNELKTNNISDEFINLVYVFDYVWYGECAIDTAQYDILKNQSQQIRSRI